MAKNYVDLGLPSGTLWATENETGNYFHGIYDYDEAAEEFGNRLPTKDDWQELIDNVPHSFDEKLLGLLFTAPNGNELFLPITGFSSNSRTLKIYYYGYYLSHTPCGSNSVYCLHFDQHKVRVRGGREIVGQRQRYKWIWFNR